MVNKTFQDKKPLHQGGADEEESDSQGDFDYEDEEESLLRRDSAWREERRESFKTPKSDI